MAHSLHSTKRKFHKLLDSLTNNNNSSTSLPSSSRAKNASSVTLPSQSEPHTKKQRVSRPTSSGQTSSSLRGHADSNISDSRRSSDRPMVDRERPSHFAPLDRRQFLERLKTFRYVDKWSSKPEAVNEVQWAKRGWICVGKERVGCVGGCGREVVVKLERQEKQPEESTETEGADSDDWDTAVDEELTERYAQMIISGHDVYCLWRKRGCDDSIYRLSFANTSHAVAELRKRYESLAAIQSEMPTTVSTPSEFDIASVSQLLSADFFGAAVDSLQSHDPNPQAMSLALFGWQSEAGHVKGLITCDACFRRLGLWLFKAKKSSSTSIASEEDGDAAAMSRLDAVDEHRYYCPWINATTQNGSMQSRRADTSIPYLAGWKLLLRALKIPPHLHSDYIDPSALSSEPETPRPDTASDAVSTVSTVGTLQTESRTLRDAKDKERWAKVKKLQRSFNLKLKKTPKVKRGDKEGDVLSEKHAPEPNREPAIHSAS